MSGTGMRRAFTAAIVVVLLLAVGCSDDDDGSASTDDAGQTEGAEGATSLDLTMTADGVEGLSDNVASGVVAVTVTNEDSQPLTLDLIQVQQGAAEAEVGEALVTATQGGPIADVLVNATGSPTVEPGSSVDISVLLVPGSWYASSTPDEGEGEEEPGDTGESSSSGASSLQQQSPEDTSAETGEGEGGGAPPPLVPFTVVEGGGDAALPQEGSVVTAQDYSFEFDIKPDADTLTFENQGPEQFHHAVFLAFADGVDEATARSVFEQFLQAGEEEPPPPEVDLQADVAATDVVGPGLGVVQPQGDFEAGRTYAVVCFIQDRSGGPPHAIEHDMWDVFTVAGG